MKLFLLAVASALLARNNVGAFGPSPSVKKASSTLPMASTARIGRSTGVSSNKNLVTPVPSKNKANWLQKQTLPDVIIDPSFRLTWSVAALGPLIWWYHPSYAVDGTPSLIGIFGGGFHILFAALLWVQTSRVRCVFEKDGFEFYNIEGPGLDLDKGAKLVRKPDNYVSGTRNRWNYDTIINYGFFPSLEFPVICYFKETATPEEQWNKWFAALDFNNIRGQPHFFPGICNVNQFKKQMELRGAKKKSIKTFKSTYGNK